MTCCLAATLGLVFENFACVTPECLLELFAKGEQIMQVFLLKDLPGKGRRGEIINANDGYAKNYLIKTESARP